MLPIGREVSDMEMAVIKIGGSVLNKLPKAFYEMIVQLKDSGQCQPIIVHGGGPEINQTLTKLEIEPEFTEGLRVTSEEVLKVVETVLSGTINKQIVKNFYKSGGSALGLSGIDGSILKVNPADPSGKLGFVGEVSEVNTNWIRLIVENDGIPVISPIGIDVAGQHYNINGDTAAGAVAKSLKAKLMLISDIPGVLEESSGKKTVLPQLTNKEVEEKIASGVIYGGMIPKVRSAIKALTGGVNESVILNGFAPDDLKSYIEGKRAGTKIVLEELQYASNLE